MTQIKVPVVKTVTTTEKIEVELELPCCTKKGYDYFYIISEKDVIRVSRYEIINEIHVGNTSFSDATRDGFEVIPQKEFDEVFTIAMDTVIQLNLLKTKK